MKAKKKVAVKKTVKKAVKRVVKARKKNTEVVVEKVPDQAAAATDTAVVDGARAVGSDANGASSGSAQSSISVLQSVHIVDLRGASLAQKIGLLFALDNDGYVPAADVEGSLLLMSGEMPNVQALEFNHNNKLVRVTPVESINQCGAVSRLDEAKVSVNVGFSRPGPVLPDTIQVAGGLYARVS